MSITILSLTVLPKLRPSEGSIHLAAIENKENSTNTNTTAAICSIVKDSLRYIDEWVDYHLALGFDQIIIYDNSDDFNTEQWWKERNSSQLIVRHWVPPVVDKQRPAYKDCIDTMQKEPVDSPNYHDWLAFIDLDEFIVLKKHEYILDLLETVSPEAGGLALNWQVISYSNQTEYKPLPVTKRFQWRAKAVHNLVKTIGKTALLKSAYRVHNVAYNKEGAFTEATNGHRFDNCDHWNGPTDVANIYHFWSKSLEEFRSRCNRGDVAVSEEENTAKYCKSKEEALDLLRDRARDVVFDDIAWQLLKERVPKYARYDNSSSDQ